MKVVFILLVLFSFHAQANTCSLLFKSNSLDAYPSQAKELQSVLNLVEPTTRNFQLMGDKLKMGDMVVIQMTREAFDHEALPLLINIFETKSQLMEARMGAFIDGLVVGSVVKYDRVTKNDEIHIAIYDENTSNVFFVSQRMIEPEGDSQIAGHKYNQLRKNPVHEMDEHAPPEPHMDSQAIH